RINPSKSLKKYSVYAASAPIGVESSLGVRGNAGLMEKEHNNHQFSFTPKGYCPYYSLFLIITKYGL
ncbi:hypothetical protein, partial [Desulfosporosinus fructosivorans]